MKDETEQNNSLANFASKSEMLSNLEGPNLTFQIHEEDHTLGKLNLINLIIDIHIVLNHLNDLGNALRHLAMLNQNTTFAGYAIPHPSISTMNLRIETISNVDNDNKDNVLDLKTASNSVSDKKGSRKKQSNKVGATQVLLKACDDLNLICNKIEDKFDMAVQTYLSSK